VRSSRRTNINISEILYSHGSGYGDLLLYIEDLAAGNLNISEKQNYYVQVRNLNFKSKQAES
jgi:hypothetical protein